MGWRSRFLRALSKRIVVRGSACRAAIWTSRRLTPASSMVAPDGKSWVAEGPDLFKALRALRRILDPLGVRLGVNGARRDAWASGMQCDMGEGRAVYLLAEGQVRRPEQVSTLGPTPLSHVGTVDDQDQQHEQWLRSRRTIN